MLINLNYGKCGLQINLPDSYDIHVIRKNAMPILENPEAVLNAAFNNPVGSESLESLAAQASSVCIVICDITRPVPNGRILPTLVKRLVAAGILAENIKILVGTGLHRPNLGDELSEIVGDAYVLNTVEVVNHFARRDVDHVDLGFTKQGTPVKLDRRLCEADLKISVGLVEPHFMAGYSGGRKVIVPGVAHRDTITRLHTTRFLENLNAANCVIEGNPLHEEQIEIMRMLGRVFSVNTVLDDERNMSFINFGEVNEAHLEAVAFMRQFAEVPIEKKFSTVVTSCAGYPLDTTYYQTVKGMVAAMDILKPGGKLFIASSCANGMGSSEYVEAQKQLVKLGVDGFLNQIDGKSFAAIDEWQTEMQLKPMRIGDICLYTDGLSADDNKLTGVATTENLETAIRDWVDHSGDNAVAVIPEGPYVIPVFK